MSSNSPWYRGPQYSPQSGLADYRYLIQQLEKDLGSSAQLEIIRDRSVENFHVYDSLSGKSLAVFDGQAMIKQGGFSAQDLTRIQQAKEMPDPAALMMPMEAGPLNPAYMQSQSQKREARRKLVEELEKTLPPGVSIKQADATSDLYQIHMPQNRRVLFEVSGYKLDMQQGLSTLDLRKIENEKIRVAAVDPIASSRAETSATLRSTTDLQQALMLELNAVNERKEKAMARKAQEEKEAREAQVRVAEAKKQAAEEQLRKQQEIDNMDEGSSLTPRNRPR